VATGKLRRRLAAIEENLTARPDAALTDILRIPEPFVSPTQRIIRRIIYATLALLAAVLIVYLDRHGYRDVRDEIGHPDAADGLSFLDCVYYATVSLSTTGYGDITPVTPSARLINVLVITPLRVAFLIVLIGTTVETLTTQSRQALKIQRWRSRVRNHTVVIGYGTKGRTAVAAMVGDEVAPADIVVVDENATALERAKSAGLVTVHGDATKSEILRLASTQHAKSIIVATDDDASAVLVTLTARELAPNAKIIAAAREAENQHLLRQSGADSTVVSAETAGRLLGLATQTPSVVEMMEDLLTPSAGFALAEREVTPKEVGGSPRHLTDLVLGVVRDGRLLRVDEPEVDAIEATDRLLYIRSAEAER
jgi:voltage-gated potassium channel